MERSRSFLRAGRFAFAGTSILTLTAVLAPTVPAQTSAGSRQFAPPSDGTSFYVQHNFVSDLSNPPGGAPDLVDPHLVNPWGVALSSTSPFWISDQGGFTPSGPPVTTVYGVNNGKLTNTTAPLLVVDIPGSSPGGPTGQVFNSTTGFKINGTPASFIFSALNGTINAWNSTTTSGAQLEATGAPAPAVYTGLAIANRSDGPYLYAANAAANRIDVFDQNFSQVTLPGSPFTDPNLPPGDVVFNVVNLNGALYVTYEGPYGVVNIFDADGNFIRRFATGGTVLNPWGVVMAPANFGKFSNALLIGNFNHSMSGPNGFGWISAFDPVSGKFLGVLEQQLQSQSASQGKGYGEEKQQTFPILIDGLWSLVFGNGGNGGDPSVLYFTAGIGSAPGQNLETHGLFGSLSLQPKQH